MIVKMCFNPEGKEMNERIVECDTIVKNQDQSSLTLSMYKDGHLIESPSFEDNVRIFIMEEGKTVDRIFFNKN